MSADSQTDYGITDQGRMLGLDLNTAKLAFTVTPMASFVSLISVSADGTRAFAQDWTHKLARIDVRCVWPAD